MRSQDARSFGLCFLHVVAVVSHLDDLDLRMLFEQIVQCIEPVGMGGVRGNPMHDRDLPFVVHPLQQLFAKNSSLNVEVVGDVGQLRSLRRCGYKEHDWNAAFLGLPDDRHTGVHVDRINGNPVRVRRNRPFQQGVLLHQVGLCGRLVVDGDLGAKLLRQPVRSTDGRIPNDVEPRLGEDRDHHEPVLFLEFRYLFAGLSMYRCRHQQGRRYGCRNPSQGFSHVFLPAHSE